MDRLTTLLDEIQRNQFSTPSRLKELSAEAVELARTDNHSLTGRANLVKALGSLSYACQVSGDYELAFEHAMEAIEIADSKTELRLSAMIRFASLMSDLGADNVALLSLGLVEKQWTDTMDRRIMMRTYVSMATSYLRQEQPDLALEKLGNALNLANQLGDERTMYWCIHSTGIAQGKKGDHHAALEKYLLALGYYKETGQYYNVTAVEMLLGESLLHINLERAKYHLDIALALAKEHGFELLNVQTKISLSDYYRAIGDQTAATRTLQKAADALKTRDHETKSSKLLLKALSKHFEQLGQLEKALEFARGIEE